MDHFETLLEAYVAGTASKAELDEFIASLPENESKLERKILDDLEQQSFQGLSTEKQRARMLSNILLSKDAESQIQQIDVVRRIQPWKWIAAASVILMAVTVSLYLGITKPGNHGPVAKTPEQKTDIAPGHDGAILTLSDGRQIVLDSTHGNVANEGGVAVINKDGSVHYAQPQSSNLEAQTVYNTITTPKGRQYQLMLADGSKVWLNAASSIRFPTAFTGKERNVEITGEAYFEVAHDAAKPFMVSVNDMKVEVLGTHFNINSYADEQTIKTTLLEGKVRVTKNGNIALLKPGEQAVAGNGQLTIDSSPDLEEVMAWKNGLFHFSNASLQEVIRQIVRWYDVEVVYEGRITERKFGGEISRSSNLSQVIKVLEESKIHCTIENNKLVVRP